MAKTTAAAADADSGKKMSRPAKSSSDTPESISPEEYKALSRKEKWKYGYSKGRFILKDKMSKEEKFQNMINDFAQNGNRGAETARKLDKVIKYGGPAVAATALFGAINSMRKENKKS